MRARKRPALTRVVHVEKLPEPVKPGSRLVQALALLGSIGFHIGLGLLIVLVAAVQAMLPAPSSRSIEIAVVEKEKPPPPPEPPKPEEPKKIEAPKVVKKVVVPLPKDAPPPPPKAPDLPPPPNEPPPPEAKPQAPIMIGISMSSTTTAGGFAAPVGNTLYGQAPTVAPSPSDVKPYSSPTGRYVPPAKVTRIPELVSEVKPEYPAEARKQALEGQVVLRLTIDSTGKVSSAKVLKGAGHGFDESALKAIENYKFTPGYEGDEAVTTEITFNVTFILD